MGEDCQNQAGALAENRYSRADRLLSAGGLGSQALGWMHVEQQRPHMFRVGKGHGADCRFRDAGVYVQFA